ncbi:hypothetical protein [Arsenophonus endosymbiont of Aleurodicus floccissimus]|uniref:hypothetical protein n=1 Tax=Arsenophonus endosymbiont of Aleurodicus floccissimus TaxID=2152761 RepID=UPI000E6B1661|nr:hypothetical protein [Arsenophonus endosymbiont of Aleurodicus floccissimus]
MSSNLIYQLSEKILNKLMEEYLFTVTGGYSYDLDEIDILMKNKAKYNIIVDNQLYNITLRLSDVSIENIIISN